MAVELLEAPIEVSIATTPKTAHELGRPQVDVRNFYQTGLEMNSTVKTMQLY